MTSLSYLSPILALRHMGSVLWKMSPITGPWAGTFPGLICTGCHLAKTAGHLCWQRWGVLPRPSCSQPGRGFSSRSLFGSLPLGLCFPFPSIKWSENKTTGFSGCLAFPSHPGYRLCLRRIPLIVNLDLSGFLFVVCFLFLSLSSSDDLLSLVLVMVLEE